MSCRETLPSPGSDNSHGMVAVTGASMRLLYQLLSLRLTRCGKGQPGDIVPMSHLVINIYNWPPSLPTANIWTLHILSHNLPFVRSQIVLPVLASIKFLSMNVETMKEDTDEETNINDPDCAATEEEDDECVSCVMYTITSFTRSCPT